MALTNGLDAIKTLISCLQADGAQVSHVILEEKDAKAKLKKLIISGLDSNIIVLATDEGRKRYQIACMSPLLADDGQYDQNRACDAVFIRKSDEGYQVCYVELKSDSPSGYEGQFKSTQCFMGYVCALSDSLCQQPIKIARERYVVFHTDSSNANRHGKKTKTRFSPNDANAPSSPTMFCVRNGDEVRFTEFF
jgi:hypothetical protein